jgi:hypothetical protein
VHFTLTLDQIGGPGKGNYLVISRYKTTKKRMRALEMRLNWLKDREAQGQFRFFWDKGSQNQDVTHSALQIDSYSMDQISCFWLEDKHTAGRLFYCRNWLNVGDMSSNVVSFRHSS